MSVLDQVRSVLESVSNTMSLPLGHLVYHLLLLIAVEAALGMVYGEWRRARQEQSQRLLLALLGLTLVRVSYVLAALVAALGSATPETLLPPLERFADTASIALLGWAFVPVSRPKLRAWDFVFGVNLVLAIASCLAFSLLWGQAWSPGSGLDYNTYWQSNVWAVWQIGLAVLAAFVVTRGREEGWSTFLVAAFFLFLGASLQSVLASQVAHLPVWQRLGNLVAYPLVTVAVYQQIVAGLQVHSRQLQEISQASLDQIKSLLYLFEAGQQMSSSLDLPAVLGYAVEGVARALDADQSAIAFPSETDPGQMRLLAVYNPKRQMRSETPSFPLEYQLAVQQAMRRKKYVILDETENVQFRALFGLLGSGQTGPLLVQPLLSGDEAVGAVIVGNGHCRRPFTHHEAKLCQAMAGQIVNAIENTKRYQKARDKIEELTRAEIEERRSSQKVKARAEEMADRLAVATTEIEALREARSSLEAKLLGSRSEAETLALRLASLEAELARQQSDWKRTLQVLMPGLTAGVLIADLEGMIQETNVAARILLGCSREELQGTRLEALSDDEAWPGAIQAACRGEEVHVTLEVGHRALTCEAASLPGAGTEPGKAGGLVVLLRDLSAETEPERRRLEIISSMVDELRTPMTTVIGYADLLLSEAMGAVADVQRKFLMRIKASAEQMTRLLHELSREVGSDNAREGHPGRQAAVQVGPLLEAVTAGSLAIVEDKSLVVDLDLADGLPAVDVEPEDLRQALSCLLRNACLASPAGSRIQVLATVAVEGPPDWGFLVPGDDEFVLVTIQDAGEGLPEGALGRVFAPDRPPGIPPGLAESGAALAEVKAWVEASGGHLSVESQVGAGTCFRLVLPASGRQRFLRVEQPPIRQQFLALG
jgi:signal transduction histidine kinase/GAF domain-containing protein